MAQLLKILPLVAALVAAPAFAAQPDPHHPDVQSSAPAAAATTPPAATDATHGCPMADGHMMAGRGHMSGAAGQHMASGQMMNGAGGANCMQAQRPAVDHTRHHPRHRQPKKTTK